MHNTQARVSFSPRVGIWLRSLIVLARLTASPALRLLMWIRSSLPTTHQCLILQTFVASWVLFSISPSPDPISPMQLNKSAFIWTNHGSLISRILHYVCDTLHMGLFVCPTLSLTWSFTPMLIGRSVVTPVTQPPAIRCSSMQSDLMIAQALEYRFLF